MTSVMSDPLHDWKHTSVPYCKTCGAKNPYYDESKQHRHQFNTETAICEDENCNVKSDTACDTCSFPLGTIARAKALKACPNCGTEGKWKPLTDSARDAM